MMYSVYTLVFTLIATSVSVM